MASQFGRNGNDSKQERSQKILTKKHSWEKQVPRVSSKWASVLSHPPVCLRWVSLMIIAFSAGEKTILSSIPVKTAELAFSRIVFKTLLKGKVLPQERYQAQEISDPKMTVSYTYKLKSKGLCLATVITETNTSSWINRDLGFHLV